MENMFSGCSSLISLNLNNFSITSDEFNNMKNMFSGCSSLISLNLNNFSIISHDFNNRMQYMFSNCSSLISLNLNNFSIASNINYMQYMFSNCSSLISLNLNYFNISGNSNMTGIVKGCDPNLIYCTEDPNLIEQIRELNSSINNCSNICFTPNHKIIKEKKKCIDYCTNDNQYIYDLNNICYEIIPEGYYLNNSEFILEQCNIKCKNCSYESNSLCISCNNKDGYYQKSDDYNSFVECYNKEPDNYYLDNVNNIYRPIKEDSTNIIDKSNKEDSINIIDKSNKEDSTNIIDKSIKEDSTNIIESSNLEYESMSLIVNNNINNKGINLEINNNNTKDEIIEIIQEKIKNLDYENLKEILSEMENKNIQYILLYKDNEMNIVLTTTEYQNNNNITTINFGGCERKLKKEYNILEEEPLIIYKIDVLKEEMKIPQIEYELYYPLNGSKLESWIYQNVKVLKLN